MQRRSIAFGIVGTLLLATCGAGIVLMSLTGWLFFSPTEKSRLIQIAPVAPLSTPVAVATQAIAASPPGLVPAAMIPARATNTPTPAPISLNTIPSPTATHSPTPIQKGIVTRLVIPKLNLDAPVLFSPVENGTWKVDHLGQAVGHLEATAPPGSESNIVLAGHVTLATGEYGPFANLSQLAPGDLVIVYEADQKFFYVIENSQTVDRNSVGVTYPSNTGQITLVTCINWNNEAGRYNDRLIVRGRLIKY